jgi:hypothetical protein
MYGERVVIAAVPAFMITNGIFASVQSGAIAIALGVKITPVSRFTLSRTISSCATCRALSGLGPVSSRTRISSFTPGGRSFSCCFMYRRMPRSMYSPRLAFSPE